MGCLLGPLVWALEILFLLLGVKSEKTKSPQTFEPGPKLSVAILFFLSFQINLKLYYNHC